MVITDIYITVNTGKDKVDKNISKEMEDRNNIIGAENLMNKYQTSYLDRREYTQELMQCSHILIIFSHTHNKFSGLKINNKDLSGEKHWFIPFADFSGINPTIVALKLPM